MTRKKLRVHQHEIEIQAASEDVWRALTDAEELARWIGWEADHTTGWIEDVFVRGRTSGEEERYLLLGDRDSHFVEFFVEHRQGRTRIRMVHSGELEGSNWDGIYDGEFQGWKGYLETLRHYLERHFGTPKRGFHAGALSNLSPDQAFEALLGPSCLDTSETLRNLTVGDEFDTTTAAGDRLLGSVYIRPVGGTTITLVLRNFADALLHVAANPAVPAEVDEDGVVVHDHSTYESHGGRPQSQAVLVLSAWGVEDATYEAIRDRTRGLFEALFPRGG